MAIWNIKREKATILYANIGIKDFKRIKQIAKKTKSEIKIKSKKGVPFIFHKYRKRKIFAILFSLIIVLLIVMSKFIWNIEINGNIDIPKEEIIRDLAELGLKTGATKKSINTKQVINKIRLIRDDIAWIGIDIKGTNAVVEIKEVDKAPKIIDKNDYCSIVADKTGIITKISVQDGTAAVAVGDLVKKGDKLVYGYVEGKYTDTRYVHAISDIEAKTWYSKKENFFYNQDLPTATGNIEEKYSIKIQNFKINFYKTLSKFEKYDTINESKKIMLFPNFYIPIEINKITNKEYVMVQKTYTEEELLEIATYKLEQEIEKQVPEGSNIINKQINTWKGTDYIEVEVIYEVLESIGIEEKIM